MSQTKEKYTIGLDIRMLRHTGIGTYIDHLLKQWIKKGRIGGRDFALFGPEELIRHFPQVPGFTFKDPIYSIAEQVAYPSYLKHCALWHSPHYNVPWFKGKTKVIVTIHDLIHWIFRREFFTPVQAFYAGAMIRRALHHSAHVITVSQKTKEDLIEYFNGKPEKISVVHEGVSPDFFEIADKNRISEVLKKYGINGSYFIFVGSLKPHKNVLWLTRLFKKMKQEGKTKAQLVIVGKKDKRYPAGYEELSALASENGIIHLSNITKDELITLYNGALALIHPSRYEGFGLTLLEAMACGTPVLALKAGSVPEIAGDAALLVEPGKEEDMKEAIGYLETNSAVREDLKAKGRIRVKNFQWENTAAQTETIFRKVLEA